MVSDNNRSAKWDLITLVVRLHKFWSLLYEERLAICKGVLQFFGRSLAQISGDVRTKSPPTRYHLLAMNERKRTLSKKHDKREDWFKEPVNVTMTRDTKHSCEVFRKKSMQPVEDGECVIHYPNKDSFYPIRFAHDSIIEKARKLRAGDNLVLLKARFRRPFGRSETQLYVKSFEVTKGD